MIGFGEKLKELRKEYNITQKQLAELLGQAQSTIVYWEKNEQEPVISSLKKLCGIFNVTSDYFIGLEDEFGNKITQNKSNNEYFIYNDGTHYIKHKKN